MVDTANGNNLSDYEAMKAQHHRRPETYGSTPHARKHLALVTYAKWKAYAFE